MADETQRYFESLGLEIWDVCLGRAHHFGHICTGISGILVVGLGCFRPWWIFRMTFRSLALGVFSSAEGARALEAAGVSGISVQGLAPQSQS